MDPINTQYLMAVVTILLGISGLLLPYKYNLFSFKRYGIGKFIASKLSDQTKEKIPKVIGVLCIFTGCAVFILTYFLGEMPWG